MLSIDGGPIMYKFLLNLNMGIVFVTITQLVISGEALCDALLGKLTCKKKMGSSLYGPPKEPLGKRQAGNSREWGKVYG